MRVSDYESEIDINEGPPRDAFNEISDVQHCSSENNYLLPHTTPLTNVPEYEDVPIPSVRVHNTSEAVSSHLGYAQTLAPCMQTMAPSIVISDVEGRLRIPSGQSLAHYPSNEDYASPTTLINQVYMIFVTLLDFWKPKLHNLPEIQLCYLGYTPQQLFERGVQTLQGCYLGNPPPVFSDFVALVPLIFAFTHVAYGDGGTCYSVAFAKELYSFRLLIEDHGQASFELAFHHVWCPWVSAHDIMPSLTDQFFSSSWVESPTTGLLRLPATFPAYPSAFGQVQNSQHLDSLEAITEGCSRFLNC